mgnify:CR=1 FL=1
MVFALLAAFLLLPLPASASGIKVPLYLFGDMRYWLFFGVYTAATIMFVVGARWVARKRDAKTPFPLRDVSAAAAIVLFNGLAYQIAHHTEHLTQIYQYWYLHLRAMSSKGIIFFLDLEWNHFIFDMGYFWLLFVAFLLFYRRWKARGHWVDGFGMFLWSSTLIIQGWHAIEHTVRIIRHVQLRCEPCAGVADVVFNVPLIPLHFWFNVFALTLPLMAFFYYRMDACLVQLVRRAFTRKAS